MFETRLFVSQEMLMDWLAFDNLQYGARQPRLRPETDPGADHAAMLKQALPNSPNSRRMR